MAWRTRSIMAAGIPYLATAVLLLAASPGGQVGVGKGGKALEASLRKAFEDNLRAAQQEDLPGVMATLHSRSPGRAPTEGALKQLFAAYDLKYELLSFHYIGRDSDYAVARGLQRTTRQAGPAFGDNQADAVHVFRQEGEAWKLWTTAVLEVKYLGGPAGSPARPPEGAGHF